MAVGTLSSSLFGNGAGTKIFVYGPFQTTSLLDNVTLWGEKTDSLSATGVSCRIGLFDFPPADSSAFSSGEMLANTFNIASPGSFFGLTLFLYKRILSKRYVCVELSVDNSGTSYVAGANVAVRPPIVQRQRGSASDVV